MAELENVMQRLADQTERLQKQSRATPQSSDDTALLIQGLALVSEAVLRVGRDVRFLRLALADK